MSDPATAIDIGTLQDLNADASRSDLFERIKQGKIQTESLPRTFAFPGDTRPNSLFGVDISHWTASDIPIEQFAALNIHYVYAKATQGTTFKDGLFAEFWKRLGNLPADGRVFRGPYHFLEAVSPGAAQADVFIAFMRQFGGIGPTDLPPALDLEWDVTAHERDRWVRIDPQAIVDSALAWLNAVQSAFGRTPILYTSAAFWSDHHMDGLFSQVSAFPIWVADYSRGGLATERPAMPNDAAFALWQFTNQASAGTATNLDANIFAGSEADFLRTFGMRQM